MEDNTNQPGANQQTKGEDQLNENTDLAILEQDKSTLKILQEDDLKSIKETLEKIRVFKRKYTLKKLTVNNIESKEEKEKLRLALQDLRSTRTGLKDEKTEKTKPYRETVSFINGNYDKVIEAIESIEAPLIAHNKQVKLDIEEKEKADEIAKKKLVNERVERLIAAGLTFNDGYYEIGSVELEVPMTTLGMIDIESMSDELFEKMFIEATDKVALVAEKKIAAEELKKTQKEEKEKKEAEEELQRQNEKKELTQTRIDTRSEVLEAQGMVLNESKTAYVYEDLVVTLEDIGGLDKTAWDPSLAFIRSTIATKKETAKKALEQKERLEKRPATLIEIGLAYNENRKEYVFRTVIIRETFITDATDEAWVEFFAETKKEIEAIKLREKTNEERHLQLIKLGYTEVIKFSSYNYKAGTFNLPEKFTDTDEEWNKAVAYLTVQKTVIEEKIALQLNRYKKLSPYAGFGQQVNMDKLYEYSDQAFDGLYSTKKAAYDKKIADDLQAEKDKKEKEEKETLAKSSDSEKWAHFIKKLSELEISEMESESYQSYAETAKKKISEIILLA